jgi:pilus assembly protein CpaB
MEAKPKTVLIIGILAVAVAGIASISLYKYLKGQEAMVQGAVATQSIVVSAQEIPVGSTIISQQVKMLNWPKAAIPAGQTFSSAEQVIGRTAIDRYTAGEPIVESKLMPKEGQSGILTYKIPEGHRAMTVAVDQVSGVAGFISPGNKVDVVLTTTTPGASQPVSKIVLQDVPVLATGQVIAQEKKDEKPVVVPTVTMDVTPEDAEKLAIASTQGRLQLVLRRVGDKEVSKTTGSTVKKVMTGVSEAEPKAITKTKKIVKSQAKSQAIEKEKKPEKLQATIEILRGSQKTEKTFTIE